MMTEAEVGVVPEQAGEHQGCGQPQELEEAGGSSPGLAGREHGFGPPWISNF